ncbi:polysaccharide deacetylase family protein [Actinoplanes subglobosus]|uniref:Polysaccharide deacetylase family protein n=1 Tax=Actinoplanes subglobosus TaxID=1547892 RepID=A0ABV8J0G0_9ACTN
MNTDRPAAANQSSTSSDEPTVVVGSSDEPTVVVGPSPSVSPSPSAEPTVDLSADDGDEETVTLSAADEAEPTVALSLPDEAESTVALSLPDEAEQTVALAAVDVAEPTIALPKPRVSPEASTSAATARPPEPETTVALPPVPAQRSASTAPTVAPPPAEPTIALPVSVPPVAVPSLSRRRLLWAIPAVAGTALIGGTIAALAGRGEPEAAKAPNLQVSEPAPAPTQSPAPVPTAPEPTTAVMSTPVHTLKDFRKVVPGDPFPADAIALTIDDGPHPVWTPKILRLLEKHDVPALFCMIGNQVLGHEPTARDVAGDGHLIANHTWSHPIDLAELPGHAALKEIHRAQDKIYSTTGITPSLFRAPGGAWSKGLSESVSKSNVIPMDWSADPSDWSQPGVAHITQRLLAAKPGQILLCHDGGGDRSQTLASLKTVIPALQARGLKFVALK